MWSAGDHRAHRRVRGGDALRGRDHVRLVAVAFAAEPVAEPAPRADHLVGDQQHTVAVADLAHALEVAVLAARSSRRRSAPARGSPRRPSRAPRTRSPPRSRPPPTADRDPRSSGRSSCSARGCPPGVSGSNGSRSGGQPGRGQRAHRGAVVGELARDQLVRLGSPRARVVGLGELPCRLDRLRAARGEEHPVQVPRRELRDPRGQLDRARVGVAPVRVEAELLGLLARRPRRARRGRGRCSRSTAPTARRGSACRARRTRSSRRRGRSRDLGCSS